MQIDLRKVQLQLDWLKRALYLETQTGNATTRTVKRGFVYDCDLGVGIGSEMQKIRPCIVIQNDRANKTSPNTIVVPITHDNSTLPCMVPLSTYKDTQGNTLLDGSANTSCVTSVSKARLGNLICELNKNDMLAVEESIAVTFGLITHYNAQKKEIERLRNYIGTLNGNNQ